MFSETYKMMLYLDYQNQYDRNAICLWLLGFNWLESLTNKMLDKTHTIYTRVVSFRFNSFTMNMIFALLFLQMIVLATSRTSFRVRRTKAILLTKANDFKIANRWIIDTMILRSLCVRWCASSIMYYANKGDIVKFEFCCEFV